MKSSIIRLCDELMFSLKKKFKTAIRFTDPFVSFQHQFCIAFGQVFKYENEEVLSLIAQS